MQICIQHINKILTRSFQVKRVDNSCHEQTMQFECKTLVYVQNINTA